MGYVGQDDDKEKQNEEKELTPKPTLDETFEALRTFDSGVPSRTLYYGLSGLTPSDLKSLESTWSEVDRDTRRTLLSELAEASELNFDLDYRELGFWALNDNDGDLRAVAIELLWEDESTELMNRLIDLTQWDESLSVRAAAASALGRFILLSEYEELPGRDGARAQDAVISLLTDQDEDVDVRRRALEAISNSSHEIVPEVIQEAYNSGEEKMKVSAVFAMGRTCDPQWHEIVLREIDSYDPEMRYEAARAAGELELAEAVPTLGRLSLDDDREIKEVAIWSLGEIGGREALRILSALAEDAQEAEDESLLEVVEDAIGNASMVGDEMDFDDL
jgi:HEAT repeat protein